MRALRAGALATLVIAISCSSKPETTTPGKSAAPDWSALGVIALPELSRVSPSVQKQLRDGYASLTEKMQNAGTTDAELGSAYGDMGKLLMAAEYRDVAALCFLNAQILAPTEIRWPYYLAHVHMLQGDPVNATKTFERALRLRPDDVPTLVWLASAYLDEGRPADAEPLLTKALALQPRWVSILFGLGRVALAKQEYARAVDYFGQALSLDPKAVTIHYQLAMAYRGMGDLANAEAHLRQRHPGEIRPRSADVGAEWAARKRRGLRGPRRLSSRRGQVGRCCGILQAGHGISAERALASAQAGHGAGDERR